MMSLIIETREYLPCSLKEFKINGVDADINDFGSMEDTDADSAEEYSCGFMQFVSRKSDYKVNAALYKYCIDEKEYDIIVDTLKEKLLVGVCSLCV